MIKPEKTLDVNTFNSKLNPNDIIPLYYQLKDIIQKKIISGEWEEGSLIPSENDLMEIFNISRSTVRQAFDILSNEGYLEKRRGRGTFVKSPKLEENLAKLKSFTEEMEGHNAYKKVVLSEYVKPPKKIKKVLQLNPDEQVLFLKRVMFVDDKPLGILIEFVRGKYNLSLNEDYSKSLYNIFEKYQIQLKTAEQVIEAATSTKEEMTLLGFKKKFTTLLIKRICYSTADEPVEYVKGVYHAQHYRYFLKLVR